MTNDKNKATVETPPGLYDDCLRNLLAVIHRDGGHYAAEHGIAKASKDAEAIVVKLLASETLQPASDLLTDIRKHIESRKQMVAGEPTLVAELTSLMAEIEWLARSGRINTKGE